MILLCSLWLYIPRIVFGAISCASLVCFLIRPVPVSLWNKRTSVPTLSHRIHCHLKSNCKYLPAWVKRNLHRENEQTCRIERFCVERPKTGSGQSKSRNVHWEDEWVQLMIGFGFVQPSKNFRYDASLLHISISSRLFFGRWLFARDHKIECYGLVSP